MDRMLSRLSWLCAAGGTLIPGYVYFTSYEPPLFHGIGLVTSALAGALIVVAWLYAPGRPKGRRHRSLRAPCVLLASALVLLVVYVVMLRYCTVRAPQENGPRYQIGFGKCKWSLTELGLSYRKGIYRSESVEKWMLAEAAFHDGGPERLWKTWSTLLSGTVMIGLYLVAFVFWTCGFAMLAKHCAMMEEGSRGIERGT